MLCFLEEITEWIDEGSPLDIIYLDFQKAFDKASRLLAAGTSTLWISTNVTKDADSDCSGTITGTLLLFTFTKKA